MGKRVYVAIRDLHLYLGLFLSPFVLVFAVSVFYLVHSSRNRQTEHPALRPVAALSVSEEVGRLTGREQVAVLRPVLNQLGVRGEVNFIRKFRKNIAS